MINDHNLKLELGKRWEEWNSAELVSKVFLRGRRNKRTAAAFPFFSAGTGRAHEVNGGGPVEINLKLPVSSSVTAATSSLNSGSEVESNNKNSTTGVSMKSTGVGTGGGVGGQQVATTKDTLVVLITLAIILITLVISYFFWKKHRSRRRGSFLSGGGGGGAGNHSSHSVYMYSRLSQNDVEVDNISFQGDLTHKALVNQSGGHGDPIVPSCGVDDDDDDQVRPATLCLEYDSLVTISNDQHEENHNNDNGGTARTKNMSLNNRHHLNSSSDAVLDDAPVNLLMDDLSDEDLLQ